VLLYPLYHPAAALYTPSMLRALEDDFARLPALLGHTTVTPVSRTRVEPPSDPPHRAPIEDLDPAEASGTLVGAVQLGLF